MVTFASVAQLDRAAASDAACRGFESRQAYHISNRPLDGWKWQKLHSDCPYGNPFLRSQKTLSFRGLLAKT